MDFEFTHTSEQEEFRKEVRAWIGENVDAELGKAPASDEEATRQYLRRRALGRKLGEKGWNYPGAPVEYGGAGLGTESVQVLVEEMGRLDLSLPPYYDSGGWLGSAVIQVWGTDEQKNDFLPPIYKGEVRTWQLLTEPEAGSDLASVKLLAWRDGDEYVLNGQKVFVGSAHGADRFWMIARTDPDGERHQNLSWFMIDANLPGITTAPLPVLADVAEGHKNTVFFDNVRVPASALIGGENNGWKVANTHLDLEHGASGHLRRDPIFDDVLGYVRTHQRDGHPLIEDPDVQELLADLFLRTETVRLLSTRNFWSHRAGTGVPYQGAQTMYLRKITGLWATKNILDMLGPAALTRDEKWGAADGEVERHQRNGIVEIVPGGTIDIQRVIMARGMGLGRGKDSTANSARRR